MFKLCLNNNYKTITLLYNSLQIATHGVGYYMFIINLITVSVRQLYNDF